MTKLMVLLPHLASVCDSNLQPDNNNSMIVIVPTLDDCWYLDSGATNHVISDLNDLSFGSNTSIGSEPKLETKSKKLGGHHPWPCYQQKATNRTSLFQIKPLLTINPSIYNILAHAGAN